MICINYDYILLTTSTLIAAACLFFKNLISFIFVSEVIGVSLVPAAAPTIILTQQPQFFLLLVIFFFVSAVELVIPSLFLRFFF